MLEWGSRYIQHDLWTREGMRRDLAAGEAVVDIDIDLVSDAVLLDSVFFREFLCHNDIRLCAQVWFLTGVRPPCAAGSTIWPFDDIRKVVIAHSQGKYTAPDCSDLQSKTKRLRSRWMCAILFGDRPAHRAR